MRHDVTVPAGGHSVSVGETFSQFIRYGTRDIDFTRHIGISDVIMRTMANPEDRALHWIRWGYDGGVVVRVPASGNGWEEKNARDVFAFGMRSFWAPTYHLPSRSFYFVSDNNNDETFNVYRFCPEMCAIFQVTRAGYAMGYAFPPESNCLVYLGRPQKLGQLTSLFELDLDAPEDVRTLHIDDPAYRIYPYLNPVIDDANARIAFVVKRQNSRCHQNLAIYSRSTELLQIASDPEIGRNFIQPLGWMEDRLLLLSDEGTEKQSLYALDTAKGTLALVMENPLQTADGVFDPVTKRVLVEFRDDAEGELVLVEPTTGSAIARQDSGKYDIWWGLCHPLGEGAYAASAKLRGHRRVMVCRIDAASKPDAQILSVAFEPAANETQAAPCHMEDVLYPTFDKEHQGEARQIEAVLFMPAVISPNPAQRAAIVWAHGGPSGRTTKSWNANIQFLTSLGYIVLGANPRGSTGQGKTFEDLNNRDLGGGDYLDYEYGLRYLMDRFEIPQQRIGIAGFSFGGYMANWAVTRPEGMFGFGISIAGISDLERSVAESVVATNITSEMGPFEGNEVKYRERSPITWVKDLRVPLLLIHGNRDHRVSTNQSRRFFARLKALGKDVELVEIEGEGHGFQALKSQRTSFQRQADFLRRVAPID